MAALTDLANNEQLIFKKVEGGSEAIIDKQNTTDGPAFTVLRPASSKDFKTLKGAIKSLERDGWIYSETKTIKLIE